MKRMVGAFACLLFLILAGTCVAVGQSDQSLKKAEEVLGPPRNAEHHVFAIDETYAAWLITDRFGNLSEIDVGPKFFYTTEFPTARKPEQPRYLSQWDYFLVVNRLSEIKPLGPLQQPEAMEFNSEIVHARVKVDRFENAFVEKILAGTSHAGEAEMITRLQVHFLGHVEGSPTEVDKAGSQPQVCLGYEWYYLPPEVANQLQLGLWQTFRAAGPSLNWRTCVRTVVRYDADGFSIEEPQHIQVELPTYTLRTLRGTVRDPSGARVEAVRVEIRKLDEKEVLRTKTDSKGKFAFSGIEDGEYKFKVTMDGFQALFGRIIVDRKSKKNVPLAFQLPVGV